MQHVAGTVSDAGSGPGRVLVALCIVTICAFVPAFGERRAIDVSTLEELAEYAELSGYYVRMEPGVYRLADYLSIESMGERRRQKQFQFLTFGGSDNVFDLEGVTIELDTRLRAALRPPIHTSEFVISGNNNVIRGLTVTSIGDGCSPGGSLISVSGEGNTLRNCVFHVRGSHPYGYGDLFGKGGDSIIAHQKHSGVHIVGSRTHLIGCRLYVRSFGHGYYIQGGHDQLFEDCYVEGVMRSTDEMLAEKSGPAFDAGFRSVYRNRAGEWKVAPGYMKSLAEDGFRTYVDIKGLTLRNCTAKNMRGGFELRTKGGTRVENCTAIGNERGFWVSSNAEVVNSRGDAAYGPLLFVEGDNASVELVLLETESEMNVHALATIHGTGHKIAILPDKKERMRPVPIMVGYAQPGGGEGMSPIGDRAARVVTVRNETTMPVIVGPMAAECKVITRGPVNENAGKNITIERQQINNAAQELSW